MNYSDLYLREQNRPPLMMILIAVFAIVGVGAFMLQPGGGGTTLTTRASKKTVKAMEVIPISGKQVGIFWQSDTPEQGWIVFGSKPASTPTTYLDVRDTDTQRGERISHYIVVSNLNEDTPYYFRIVSGREFISQTDGSPFSFKTVTNDGGVRSGIKPAYGKVMDVTGLPSTGVLVVMRLADAYPLVAVTKSSGEWLIPLQSIISSKTGKGLPVTEKDPVTITIYGENGTVSHIDTVIGKTNPVQETTVLGKDYRFVDDQVLGTYSDKQTSPSGANYVLDVIYPKANSVIPAVRPLLKGTGIPGTIVYASINSKPSYSYRGTVRSDGTWTISVLDSIKPGIYELKVTLIDALKKPVIINRVFSLAKSGEQVLGEATISGTLTPTVKISATPPLEITAASASPTLYKTGFNSTPLAIASFALIVIGIGILFIFS